MCKECEEIRKDLKVNPFKQRTCTKCGNVWTNAPRVLRVDKECIKEEVDCHLGHA